MKVKKGYEKCLEKLTWATKVLKVKAPPTQLAEIADLIVQPMTGPWRYFHTTNHLFEVGGNSDAIEVLAALFHDLVYIQVDTSVNFNLSYYLAPFIQEVQGQLKIRDDRQLPKDATFEMVMSIFGFIPGQILSPFGGQNEFMSAIVAGKTLDSFIKPEYLFQILTCIEATIPFVRPSADGLSASDRLYQRLQETNSKFNLNLTEAELIETVNKSVRMANRDISGFAAPSEVFIENTWNLLPETNHALIGLNSYTVYDYRVAIEKTERFLSSLNPEFIFRKFDGKPDEKTYRNLVERARHNLEVGTLYLGCKLFSIAFMEALSLRVGLNIPLSTMMGEANYQDFSTAKLVDFLPEVSEVGQPKNKLESEVLALLEPGETAKASYEANSPLTIFIIKSVGFDEIINNIKLVQDFFEKNISPEEFLGGKNSQITQQLLDAIVKLFENRKNALRGLKKMKDS
jgi:hypothetical protein